MRINGIREILRCRELSTSAEGATDNSPGREPGVGVRKNKRAREAGDRVDSEGRYQFELCRPCGAHNPTVTANPRAHARGYYLPRLRRC